MNAPPSPPGGTPGGDPLADILSRVADGDFAAFEDLYRRTSATLYGASRQILPDLSEAEVALRNAYVMIWTRARAFDARRDRALSWLIGIVRHQAIATRRRCGSPPANRADASGR